MNVARAYEAHHDLLAGRWEALEMASENMQSAIDDEIDRMTNVDHPEQSRKAIIEALDEHVDPDDVIPLLADLHLALAADQIGRSGSREIVSRTIGALDQVTYDAVSAEAQYEVARRYA